MNHNKQREKGQAIILVAFIMIGLIAMLGLAIDGGGLFFLRRDLQNAADAAIVAATYASCVDGTNAQVEAAAREAAANNGFEDGVDGVVVDVILDVLPAGASGSAADYVQVEITAPKEKFFIQVVYEDELFVSARAVGRCNKDVYSQYGGALVGTGSCTNCAVNVSGSDFELEGGSHSNDCIGLPAGNPGTHDDPTDGDTDWGDTTAPNGCQNAGSCPGPVDPAPVVNFPLVYSITEFDNSPVGGDSFVNLAIAAGRYYNYTGNVTIPNGSVTDVKMKTGVLVYATGTITIDWNAMNQSSYKMTLVGNKIEKGSGTPSFTGPVDAYLDDLTGSTSDSLLWFANYDAVNPCSGGSAAGIQQSALNWGVILYGLLYAPKSGVTFSNSSFKLEGAIWAEAISLQGARIVVHYRADMVPTSPPNIDIASD